MKREVKIQYIPSESIGRELARWAVKKEYERKARPSMHGNHGHCDCGRDNGTQYDGPEN